MVVHISVEAENICAEKHQKLCENKYGNVYDLLAKMGVEVPELLVTTPCLLMTKLWLEVEDGRKALMCITSTLCVVYLPHLGRKA